MKKTLIYVLIILALIATVTLFSWNKKGVEQPPVAEEAPSGEQVEVPIEQSVTDELQGIDLGDLEKEFADIDKDLQSL